MIENPTSKNRLVEIAKQRFNEPTRQLVHFTGDIRIDDFLNDLVCYPHAYVLVCLMDRHNMLDWQLERFDDTTRELYKGR
jgi:hypothetical protein